MANRILQNYAQTKNMLVYENFMYGIVDGYYVCVQHIISGYTNIIEICVPLVNLTDEQKESIKEFIKANKKSLKTTAVEFRQNIVAVKTTMIPNVKNGKFETTLNGVINHFKLNGYVSGCSVTNATEGIRFTLYKGAVIPVSQEVANKFDDLSKKMDAENEERGYLAGIIGACIGGIIGVVPWILLGLLGYVGAISALAMGWLIKSGYDRANGKRGGVQVAVLIIALIFFTYVGIAASQTVMLVQAIMQDGYQFADINVLEWFGYIFRVPFTGEPGASEMWGAIAQGFLFAIIGGVYFILGAKRQKGFAAGGQINTSLPQPYVNPAA